MPTPHRSRLFAVIAALGLWLLPVAAPCDADGAARPVIAPGQERVLGAMLGADAAWASGCELDDARVEHSSIRTSYKCPGGAVTIELGHPSTAAGDALRTRQFAVAVVGGAPPPGFVSELEARVLAHEAGFQWTWVSPPATHTPAPRIETKLPESAEQTVASRGTWLAALVGAVSLLWATWYLRRRSRPAEDRARGWRERAWQRLRDPRFWLLIVFLSSGIGRGWLSLINPVANDDHLEVARMIRQDDGQPPAAARCMQCAHPKLYHYAVAAVVTLADADRRQRVIGNLLNFLAGTMLLLVLAIFSRNSGVQAQVRLLALTCVSFNAAVVGIFSQATNDGFCILFSSLAIFYLSRFLQRRTLWHVMAATGFLILAALSKASGWVIFAAAAAVLIVQVASAPAALRLRYAAATTILIVGFLAIVAQTHPYRENLQQAGTPFVTDAFEAPLLKLEVRRPPFGWVVQDLFTFRILELLRTPYMDFQIEARHRNSLWTQLYGRTFFLRFDQPLAPNLDPRLLMLGRLCFLLGLLPVVALLAGSMRTLRSTWQGVLQHGRRWLAEQQDWLHVVFAATMVAALILLIVQHHRQWLLFTWMKAIYLMPAILPGFKLFLDGLGVLHQRHPRLVTAGMLALVAASIADLGWLIHDLTVRQGG